MIRFGVIGAGFIGSVHAENIAAHPRAELVSVYDIEPDRARTVADKNGAKVAGSADALLSGSNIDAVFIASSTPTHVTYLKAAARAGKAIFCEKPIDIDWSRTQEAAVALKESTVPVMIESRRKRRRDISLYQGSSVIDDGLYPGWYERIKESYILELDAFIMALEQGAAPCPSLDDGLKAQAIAEAATESFKSGRPIRISY